MLLPPSSRVAFLPRARLGDRGLTTSTWIFCRFRCLGGGVGLRSGSGDTEGDRGVVTDLAERLEDFLLYVRVSIVEERV